jgi:hypothetical protein
MGKGRGQRRTINVALLFPLCKTTFIVGWVVHVSIAEQSGRNPTPWLSYRLQKLNYYSSNRSVRTINVFPEIENIRVKCPRNYF